MRDRLKEFAAQLDSQLLGRRGSCARNVIIRGILDQVAKECASECARIADSWIPFGKANRIVGVEIRRRFGVKE